MGTRSITKFIKDGKHLLTIYKQYDGYPGGWGKELIEFTESKKFVNGYQDENTEFNGFGCYVLQLIANFKDGAGNLYACPEDTDMEEYNYTVEWISNKNRDNVNCNGKISAEINITCNEDTDFKYCRMIKEAI